jgi:NlpC/P60 family putative phage cell wall peptidase
MGTDDLRTRIIAEARAWIGTPYHHQASLKGVGCDCLGLARGVWRAVIGTEPETPPPYSMDWAEATRAEQLHDAAGRHLVKIALDAWRPGDLLLFRMSATAPAKHCGIATGAETMVHAWSGYAVAEVELGQFWRHRLVYAFSFPGAA